MSDTITIMGNLAADPEQRMIGSGTAVTSFRVASSQRHFDKKSGEWVERDPNWYQVSAFRDLGEHAFASLHKGERVIVSGRLKIRSWETDKSKGTSVEIEADAVGHDLLWGTTRYTRAAGRAESWNVPGQDAAVERTAEPETAEHWPTTQPGEGVGASEETTAADEAAPARELADAPF